MNVEALRDRLLLLLADELGTYTIGKPPKTNDTPAIAIQDSGESRPNDRAITGLEIIIRRSPERDHNSVYQGVQRKRTWQLFLVQHQGNHTLQGAIDKMELAFPNMRSVLLGANQQKNIREQVSVKIVQLSEFARLRG
jgi:hypothetical protein